MRDKPISRPQLREVAAIRRAERMVFATGPRWEPCGIVCSSRAGASMDIPNNPILFYHGDSAWTLGGVLVASGAAIGISAVALMPVVLYRLHVEGRRLSSQQAATLAMTGHQTDYVKPEAAVHGAAAGVEWHFEMTIGDLRQAWHARRYGHFFFLPWYWSTWFLGPSISCAGGFLLERDWALLFVSSILGLVAALGMFMQWAAIYTKLE
jgi:hypothetical protein